LVNLYYLKTI